MAKCPNCGINYRGNHVGSEVCKFNQDKKFAKKNKLDRLPMYTKNIVTVFEDCAVPGWNCIVSISPVFAMKRQVVTTKKLYWQEFVQASRLVETKNLTGIFKVYKRLNRNQLFTCNLFLRQGDTVQTLKARIENWLSECCDAGLIEEKSADELVGLLDKF